MSAIVQNADDLLRSGDIEGARAALVESVRTEPANITARMFLFQFLALTGEWDKARRQLTTIAQMSGEAQMLAMAYGQAIDAELERAQVFAGTVVARQHVASDWGEWGHCGDQPLCQWPHFRGRRCARRCVRSGRPTRPATWMVKQFEWIADADGRFGPCFEAIIAGKYGLQPFDQVHRIKSDGPSDLRDILWYPGSDCLQVRTVCGSDVARSLSRHRNLGERGRKIGACDIVDR